MSARGRRPFLPALRRIERELAAPIPDRIRILRELEYDLERLREGWIARGLPPDEARRRALDMACPDGQALRELDRLHAPLYRRVTGSLEAGRLRVVERGALALATGTVLVVETGLLLRADLLGNPSPFLWPVLGLGALLFALGVAKIFELWVKRDHRAPGRGLAALPALSALILLVGVGGTCVDLYRLAGVLEDAPELAGGLTAEWLVRDAALLCVSILFALAGGLVWFVVSQWFVLVTGAHREALGLDVRTRTLELEET